MSAGSVQLVPACVPSVGVGGRRLVGSIHLFEHQCFLAIAKEQAKAVPDVQLVMVLSQAVRLAREYTDLAVSIRCGEIA